MNFISHDIAPPGSIRHYSARGLKSVDKEAILSIEALYQKLWDLSREGLSTELTLQKLQWWKLEISAIQNGKASHPLCKKIAKIMPLYALSYQPIDTLLTAIEHYIQFNGFQDDKQLQSFIQESYAQKDYLIASIQEKKPNKQTIIKLSTLIFQAHSLLFIKQDLKANRLLFSDENLKKFKINTHQQDKKFYQHCQEMLTSISLDLSKDYQILSQQKELCQQSYLCSYACLIFSLLDQARKDGFQVFDFYYKLPAIRALLLSFFEQRRLRKLAKSLGYK